MAEKTDKEKKIVKLLKFVQGQWKVVDYGLSSKAADYAAMGYVVQHS